MNGRRIRPHGPAGLSLAIGVLALSGCEQVKPIEDENGGGAIPTAVQEAFNRQCNAAACHGQAPALGLSLEAANSASILEKSGVSDPSRPYVDFGNIENSFLAHKLLPDSALMDLDIQRIGLRMPNVPLTPEIQADVAIILGWIAGADLPGGGDGGTGGTADDGATTAATDASAGTTGAEVDKRCNIENLAPGSPPDLVVAGDGAMQIPTEIGAVLTNNCGCHYVDGMNPDVADIYFQGTAAQPMLISTWAEWRLAYGPMAKVPIDESLARLDPASTLPMPPPLSCDVGTGVNITAEDKALLIEWLEAGAPDGASWMGGGSTGDATGGSSSG